MKAIIIIKYELIELFRDKFAWLTMLILPIILTFILVNINTREDNTENKSVNAIPVGICIQDDNPSTKDFTERLKRDKTFSVLETDIEELAVQVKNSQLAAGFIIKQGFGDKFIAGLTPEIGVLNLNKDADYFTAINEIEAVFTGMTVEYIVKSNLSNTVAKLNIENKPDLIEQINTHIHGIMEEESIVRVAKVRGAAAEIVTEAQTEQHYSIGMIVMFIMFTVMSGAGIVLKEKKLNTWPRLLASPTSKVTILVGKILGTFVCGWIQILLLIVFGHFVLNIYFGSSLIITLLMFTVYMFSVAGLGMFLSTLINSYAQLNTLLTIVIISTSMLSGCYWPVWLMPEVMKNMAMIFPQYWAIKALEIVMGPNLSLVQLLMPLIVLIGTGMVFLMLGLLITAIKPKTN